MRYTSYFLILSCICVASIASSNSNKLSSVNTKDNSILASSSKVSKVNAKDMHPKIEKTEGLDKIKGKVKFPVTAFNEANSGLSLDKVSMDTQVDENMNTVFMTYKNPQGNTITVVQALDTGRPDDLLNECEKTKLKDGTDAWIYDPTGGVENIQVMVWRDGKYYNVSAKGVGKEKLLKFAEMLK